MANQRSRFLIKQALDSPTESWFSDLPTNEELNTLVYDHEDILFCWASTIEWTWKKGGSDIDYESRGIFILTRHRLLLAGNKPDAIEVAIELSDLLWTQIWVRLQVDLKVRRTPENEPPNTIKERTGWRHYKKDLRPEIFFKLRFSGYGMQELYYEQLRILPYSFKAYLLDAPVELNRDMELPIHPEMTKWNRLVIGYDALYRIADLIQEGKLGFSISTLTDKLSAGDKIIFISSGQTEGDSRSREASFVLVTKRCLYLLDKNGDYAYPAIGLDSINTVIHKSTIHTVKKFFFIKSRSTIETTEITCSDGKITVSFSTINDRVIFLEALQNAGLRNKLSFDTDKIRLKELEILQPFENAETTRMEGAIETENGADIYPQAGYVYILINPQYAPDLLKIGKTTRTSEERAQEIFSTGVPGEFIVAYEEHVLDCNEAELQIHARLAKYKVSDNREFFRMPLKDAVRIVSEVAMKVGVISDAL